MMCPNPKCNDEENFRVKYYLSKIVYYCKTCGYKRVNIKCLKPIIIFLFALILLYL